MTSREVAVVATVRDDAVFVVQTWAKVVKSSLKVRPSSRLPLSRFMVSCCHSVSLTLPANDLCLLLSGSSLRQCPVA